MRDDIQSNIEFCQEVGKYPNLYDYNRPDYCLLNKNLQDQAWEEIGRKFDASTGECKDRWKNIRGSYSKYKQKRKNFNHQQVKKRLKQYYLAPYLYFLDPFLKCRRPKDEIIDYDNTFSESIVKNEAQTTECEEINYENTKSVLHDDCISVGSSESSAPYNSNALNDDLKREMKPMVVIPPNDDDCIKRKRSPTTFNYDLKHQSRTKPIDPPDPDMAFLHSILPDMKSMNSSQKRHFKIGVLSLAEQILITNAQVHASSNEVRS